MQNITAKVQYVLVPAAVPMLDFVVEQTDNGEQIVRWDPERGPQPTEAEIDAVTDQQATDAQVALTAQKEKSEATKGVDDAFQKHGNRVERIVMSVATSAIKVFNNRVFATFDAMNAATQSATSLADLKTKWAALDWPKPITNQQLIDSIKADIAATPE